MKKILILFYILPHIVLAQESCEYLFNGLSTSNQNYKNKEKKDNESNHEDLENVILYTANLQIRAIGSESKEAISAIVKDDRIRQMSGDRLSSDSINVLLGLNSRTLQGYLRSIQRNSISRPSLNFGVFQDGALVGMIKIEPHTNSHEISEVVIPGFKSLLQPEKSKFMYSLNFGRLHYFFSPEVWGKGVASEALKRVVQYSFENLNLDGLHGKAISTNIGSVIVMEKNGFVEAASVPDPTIPSFGDSGYINRFLTKDRYLDLFQKSKDRIEKDLE